MNHSQVAHIWANQSKPKGKGSNLFFEGATIYSYGRHFALATHVKNSTGEPAVILTRDGYSSSTAHHKNLVWNALDYGRSVPVFYGNPAPGWGKDAADKSELRKSFAQYIADAKKAATKAKKARKYGASHAEDAKKLRDEAARLTAFFRLGMKVPTFDSLLSQEEFDRMQKQARDAKRRERIAREKRKEELRKKDAATFEAWKQGEDHHCPWELRDGRKRLSIPSRKRRRSSNLARRAGPSLSLAKRVFRFVKACKEQGQSWPHNGSRVRIGHFSLDEVDPQGNIRAGCHFITWERIAECAQAGGFFDDAASSEALERTAA